MADELNVRVREREILSVASEQLGEGFATYRWGGLKEKLPWVEIECHLDKSRDASKPPKWRYQGSRI